MLMILSPSKTMNLDNSNSFLTEGIPTFKDDALSLVNSLKPLSVDEIKNMMKVSDDIAAETIDRIQRFKKTYPSSNCYPAAYLFDGGVYAGLDAASIKKDDYEFLKKHLRILSGLYGVLKPFDKTQPYRLEMGSRLKTVKGTNLYQYWGEKISNCLNKELKAQGKNSFLLNLASDEYFKSVKPEKIVRPIIHVEFKEIAGDDFKFISYDAKKARGLMARYVIDHHITEMEALKDFSSEEYVFEKSLSTDLSLMFVRPKPKDRT